ncbi:conjugal transfer protein TraX [Clostridium estertheticum]|nr:conjugal transfer protein TraX [Clostridium estertheticum]
MLIDHVGDILFPNILFFRIIGRLSFHLFAWGIAKGYNTTRNFKKYAVRLFLLAVISQIPYFLAFKNTNINICFTLLSGLFVLKLYDSSLSKLIRWPFIIALLLISQYLHFEYGFYGVLTILIFYIYWNNDKVIYYQAILTLVSTMILKYDPIELVAILSPILILSLNLLIKKDIKINKVFRYSFYPVHLIILFLIKNGGLLK